MHIKELPFQQLVFILAASIGLFSVKHGPRDKMSTKQIASRRI